MGQDRAEAGLTEHRAPETAATSPGSGPGARAGCCCRCSHQPQLRSRSRSPRPWTLAAEPDAAGFQRDLLARAATASTGKTKAPRVLHASAGREKRRLADHRRATARTGGKTAPGTSQVQEKYTGLL